MGAKAPVSSLYHCGPTNRHDESAVFRADWLSLDANREKSRVAVRARDDESASLAPGEQQPAAAGAVANAEFATFVTIGLAGLDPPR